MIQLISIVNGIKIESFLTIQFIIFIIKVQNIIKNLKNVLNFQNCIFGLFKFIVFINQCFLSIKKRLNCYFLFSRQIDLNMVLSNIQLLFFYWIYPRRKPTEYKILIFIKISDLFFEVLNLLFVRIAIYGKNQKYKKFHFF